MTPVINLFPKRCDRSHLTEGVHEHHLIPDRTRPLDFEVYRVDSVTGYADTSQEPQHFLPFYVTHDLTAHSAHPAYYSLPITACIGCRGACRLASAARDPVPAMSATRST